MLFTPFRMVWQLWHGHFDKVHHHAIFPDDGLTLEPVDVRLTGLSLDIGMACTMRHALPPIAPLELAGRGDTTRRKEVWPSGLRL